MALLPRLVCWLSILHLGAAIDHNVATHTRRVVNSVPAGDTTATASA